jgi:hypothetical protein
MRASIQCFEALSPPSQADRSEVRIGAGRDHIGKRQIKRPKCSERRPNGPGELLERNLPIRVEQSLSDR